MNSSANRWSLRPRRTLQASRREVGSFSCDSRSMPSSPINTHSARWDSMLRAVTKMAALVPFIWNRLNRQWLKYHICHVPWAGLSVDIFIEGCGVQQFEFPRAPSMTVPSWMHYQFSNLGVSLGPQAKFQKGPTGFSGTQGTDLRAPLTALLRW